MTGRFADFLDTSSETSPTCDTYTDHETLHRKEGIGHENRRFALAHPAGSHSAKNVWHTEGKETVNPPLGGIRLPLLGLSSRFLRKFYVLDPSFFRESANLRSIRRGSDRQIV